MDAFCDGFRREMQPCGAKLCPMWRSIPPAALLFLFAADPTFPDEVYKSVDAQGHVTYSDRASSPNAQKSAVHVIQGNAADAARVARQTELLEAQDTQRKRDQDMDSRAKEKQDHDKQVLCENAKNRYFSIKDANLLYKLDAQGNRQFYTDAEADARREQARQAMVAACGK